MIVVKKILFALKDMNIGGVEKAFLSLLDTVDQTKYDVTLLLLESKGGFFTAIPEWVNVKVLEQYSAIKSIVNNPPLEEIKKSICQKEYFFAFQLLAAYIYYKLTNSLLMYYYFAFKKIPELEEKYDVAVSYTSLIPYLTYFVKHKVKAEIKLGWIHFDVSKLSLDKKTIYSLHKNLNKIYVVSRESYTNFVQEFPCLKEQCEIRYNVVSKSYVERMGQEKIDDMSYSGVKILTLGRLSKEKGQDMIPMIAAQLKNKKIDFKWYLIGEGNLKKEIEKLIERLGVEDKIVLLGSRINPYPYLKEADIYVQTSRYEGFCISLAEAKIFNLPIVTTNFAGANEQIKNKKTGSIVEINAEAITAAITELIEKPEQIKLYINNLKIENE